MQFAAGNRSQREDERLHGPTSGNQNVIEKDLKEGEKNLFEGQNDPRIYSLSSSGNEKTVVFSTPLGFS